MNISGGSSQNDGRATPQLRERLSSEAVSDFHYQYDKARLGSTEVRIMHQWCAPATNLDRPTFLDSSFYSYLVITMHLVLSCPLCS